MDPNKEEEDLRTSLRAIQAHLRGEIEWRSKECNITWMFLFTATGAILGVLFSEKSGGCVDGMLRNEVGLLLVGFVWTVGLWYILEKRTWITNIGYYLRTVVEPRLYSNDPGIGWEHFAESIRQHNPLKMPIYFVEMAAPMFAIIGAMLLSQHLCCNGSCQCWSLVFHVAFLCLAVFRIFVFYTREQTLASIGSRFPARPTREGKMPNAGPEQ